MLWGWAGTLARINDALYLAVREKEGREARPTVAVIDSQNAKAAQKGLDLRFRRSPQSRKATPFVSRSTNRCLARDRCSAAKDSDRPPGCLASLDMTEELSSRASRGIQGGDWIPATLQGPRTAPRMTAVPYQAPVIPAITNPP